VVNPIGFTYHFSNYALCGQERSTMQITASQGEYTLKESAN